MKIGIDVGGTLTKTVVLDEKDQPVFTQSYPTVLEKEPFLQFLIHLIEDLQHRWPAVKTIGIGIPGTVNTQEGKIIWCPALQVHNLDFCSILQEKISLPVVADNDVNAWALAEGKIGSCRDVEDYVLITVGTGIGSGIVLGKKIYRGKNYEAGEIGYFLTAEDLKTVHQTKDQFGCFESRASASALSARYAARGGEKIDAQEIFRRARQEKDALAMELVEQQLDLLSQGICNMICILQPSKVVLGGGLTGEGVYLSDELNRRVHRMIPSETPVVLSSVGKWGGAIGAAWIPAES